MRHGALGMIAVLALVMPCSGRAQDQAAGTTILVPDEAAPAPDASRLILPGQPDRTDPAAPVATLPPLWLVPLPDPATRAADRARLDAALEARFARLTLPPQRFDADIVPLAGGERWQAMQRRVGGTLGP